MKKLLALSLIAVLSLSGWLNAGQGMSGNDGRTHTAATDPFFANVKLLAGNDNAANGTTTFLDQSGVGRTITRGGTAVYSNAQAAPGMSTSILLTGGNFISCASNADFGYGTGDWTIEFYIYLNTTTGSPNFFDQRTGGADGNVQPVVYVNGTPAPVYYLAGDKIVGTTITTGAWHHYALTRTSTSTKEFWDGVQMGSTYSDSGNYVTSPFFLGISGDGGSNPVNAYYAGIRVTKGTGRYTGSFTPPSLPLPTS